jgi:hypothetical protein
MQSKFRILLLQILLITCYEQLCCYVCQVNSIWEWVPNAAYIFSRILISTVAYLKISQFIVNETIQGADNDIIKHMFPWIKTKYFTPPCIRHTSATWYVRFQWKLSFSISFGNSGNRTMKNNKSTSMESQWGKYVV